MPGSAGHGGGRGPMGGGPRGGGPGFGGPRRGPGFGGPRGGPGFGGPRGPMGGPGWHRPPPPPPPRPWGWRRRGWRYGWYGPGPYGCLTFAVLPVIAAVLALIFFLI